MFYIELVSGSSPSVGKYGLKMLLKKQGWKLSFYSQTCNRKCYEILNKEGVQIGTCFG